MWASKGYRAKIHIPDWKIWQIDEAVNQTSYALLVLWITIMKWTWICHVDKKIFFSNLTIIINQVWLHQKVQTTKEMRNLANYKFTVCWACMAVIKSVCKIVWRAASVLFVFQWYYNRRPPGAQPTFSLNPSLRMALVYFVGSWVRIGIHIPLKQKTLPLLWGWLKMCMMCFAIAIPQQFVHIPIWLMHRVKSVHFLSEFWALFLLPSFRSVSNLYRSCLRVGQGCTIRPRLAANLIQYLSTSPSPASIFNSTPLLGKVLTLCGRALGSLASVSSPDESTGSWLLSLLPLPYLLTQTAESLPRLPRPPFWRLGRGSCLALAPFLPSNTISGCQTFSLLPLSQRHCYHICIIHKMGQEGSGLIYLRVITRPPSGVSFQ